MKAKIYSVPPEEVSTTWEGKALMCRWFEDLYSAANIMGFCFFPVGIQLALGPNHISRLFSACTGWDTTPEDMVKFRERVLYRATPEGSSKRAVLSRDKIKQLLDE